MAYYNKIGLLVLNDKQDNFLVCKKEGLAQYIMPGGKVETGEDDLECLEREINEELNCNIIETDISAEPGKDVNVKLYQGQTIGTPKPSHEIIAIYWLGKDGVNNPEVSPIIKNKIIPDLIKRKILK